MADQYDITGLNVGDSLDVISNWNDTTTPVWSKAEVLGYELGAGPTQIRVMIEATGAIIMVPGLVFYFAPYGSKSDK